MSRSHTDRPERSDGLAVPTAEDSIFHQSQTIPKRKLFLLQGLRDLGKYLNADLAYDNNFASFVATGFSGYAVSGVAAVPVPAAIWLFGSGLAAMAGIERRKLNRTVA